MTLAQNRRSVRSATSAYVPIGRARQGSSGDVRRVGSVRGVSSADRQIWALFAGNDDADGAPRLNLESALRPGRPVVASAAHRGVWSVSRAARADRQICARPRREAAYSSRWLTMLRTLPSGARSRTRRRVEPPNPRDLSGGLEPCEDREVEGLPEALNIGEADVAKPLELRLHRRGPL